MGQLVAGCDSATAPPPPPVQAEAQAANSSSVTPENADTLIVAFGDSLYAGYGLAPSEGFAPELQATLNKSKIKIAVVNAGVSGDTTAAGLQRLAFVLDRQVRKPDLLLLGLGGNDLLRGLKPSDTRKNLTAMIELLNARKIPVMLTGMRAPPNMGKEFVTEFDAIYPDLAKKYGIKLYPFFLDGVIDQAALMQADRVHPTAQGIDKIVGKVAPLVTETLQKG